MNWLTKPICPTHPPPKEVLQFNAVHLSLFAQLSLTYNAISVTQQKCWKNSTRKHPATLKERFCKTKLDILALMLVKPKVYFKVCRKLKNILLS